MRFLITTLQTYESEFYGVVGRELERRGHEVTHVTISRRAAKELREQGVDARCLPDVIAGLGGYSVADEVGRIETTYPIPHLRDVYRNDKPCAGKPEEWCIRRTVDHFRALERVFDEVAPDIALPEVGNETIRIVTHLVAGARGVPTLFILHTIFPNPLRVCVDTLHAPIAPLAELRELSPEERQEVEAFRAEFTSAATPIREFRRVSVEARRAKVFADHVRRKLTDDRDNDYLRPWRLLHQNASEWLRARAARPFYDQLDPSRPFVYFPLHVTDDYKIQRIVPHCVDQASLVEQVADALPQGHDLVLKEHPMSLGRNSIRLLRRLRQRPNVRLVDPYTSTHELIRRAEAVVVISSTVGLEALLYDKPVLTLGDPYYAGFGVTLDVDSFAELHEKVPELLRFRPDPERITRFLHMCMRHCHPGHPLLVDRSEENALTVAETLERAALALSGVASRERAEPDRDAVLPSPASGRS
jgi:Capsule polysaccharide biosynthesis protein